MLVLLVVALSCAPRIVLAQKTEAEAAAKAHNWREAVSLYQQVTDPGMRWVRRR